MAIGILFVRAGYDNPAYATKPLEYFYSTGTPHVIRAGVAGISYYDIYQYSCSTSIVQDLLSSYFTSYNFFVHTGHGLRYSMHGDYNAPGAGENTYYKIITSDDIPDFNGKAVYSFACHTAYGLLPQFTQSVATAGYNDSYWFTWVETLGDEYFVSTNSPGFQFIDSIVDGRTWGQAYQDVKDKCDSEIAYWRNRYQLGQISGELFTSLEAIFLHNKNIIQISGDPSWTITGEEVSTGNINVATNLSGATFTITGPASYSGSGTSWSQANAPVGEYTISYGVIPGYNTPANETKTLIGGGMITFTGTYVVTTGTINVNTNNVNATFTLLGAGNYSGSGASWQQTLAPSGSYTIVYGEIEGYTKPANETQILSAGGSLTFTGNYVLSTGTINVSTNNVNVTFTLSGAGSYSGSGTSWQQTGAAPGSYTISYGAIFGYYTPANETKILSAGGSISFSGIYLPETTTCTINVTTNHSSATFTLTGPANFTGSGRSWSTTSAIQGTYTIEFGNIAGYETPDGSSQSVTPGNAISFTGNYVEIATSGTITVTSNVSTTFMVSEQSGWPIYIGSGTSWSKANAPPGTYLCAFNDLEGYITPNFGSGALAVGETLAFSGTYLPDTDVGTIIVECNIPDGSFTISGPTTYSGSGSTWTQANAPAGTYTITYNSVVNCTKPASESLTLAAGYSITFTGIYTFLGTVGNISVTTNNASATFNLTGPETYSGSGISWNQLGVPVGEYTIAYGAVAGYDIPASESKILLTGETIAFIADYNASGTAVSTTNIMGGNKMARGSRGFGMSFVYKAMQSIIPYFTRWKTDQPGMMRHSDDTIVQSPFDYLPQTPTLSVYCHPHIFTWTSDLDVDTTNSWSLANSGTGTPLAVQDERGGVAKIINGSLDNNYYSFFRKYEHIKIASGKNIWMKFKFKVSDADQVDIFIGACSDLASGNLFDNRVDAFGIYLTDGSASLAAEARKNGSPSSKPGLLTIIDDTYVNIILHAYSDTRLEVFGGLDGNIITHLASILTNLPDDETLAFAFGIRNGESVSKEMSIGTVIILQDE